jgi:adenylate cyclase
MIVAVAGARPVSGVAVAQVNLKLIWDVISEIQVGRRGHAFVLDRPGTLVAHPDLSIVLRGPHDAAAQALEALRGTVRAQGGAATGQDAAGRNLVAASALVPGVDWTVVVYQPVAEAFGPIYAALVRTAGLLLVGAALAAGLAYWLAQRIARPVQDLEDGAKRIGAGHLDYRIPISSADELGRLATQFNRMASELAISLRRSERLDRLKRFLAPQVAELLEEAGDETILDSRRADIVAVFCDLRGFTAFSARAEPEIVMDVLGAYYDTVERIIVAFGATVETARYSKPHATRAASLMHVPPSGPGNGCEPALSFQFRM